MKKALGSLVIICMMGFLGGCASVFSGTTQKVNITTDSGKQYTAVIDNQKYTVPSIIELKRENKDKILTLEGCPNSQTLIHKEVNPVFFVNLLSAGVFGSTTDAASGAMWKYEPQNVSVKCP